MEDALVEVDILVSSDRQYINRNSVFRDKHNLIIRRKNWLIKIEGGLTAFAYLSTFIIEGISALSPSYLEQVYIMHSRTFDHVRMASVHYG